MAQEGRNSPIAGGVIGSTWMLASAGIFTFTLSCVIAAFGLISQGVLITIKKPFNSWNYNMLEIRPNCELCDKDLPPASADARICTYECTYCVDCVEKILRNVCPTCGGGLVPRPIRPETAFRPKLKLGLSSHPASTNRHYSKFSMEDIAAHVIRIKDIPPNRR